MSSLAKILYVEDEEDIREVAKLALEAVGGFEVKLCGSGTDALQEALLFSPDLILLDVMMPGMDGQTTFQELRKIPQLANTPIIFMTAKVQEVARYKEMGALDVIAKPFDPMILSDQIKAIWEQHS